MANSLNICTRFYAGEALEVRPELRKGEKALVWQERDDSDYLEEKVGRGLNNDRGGSELNTLSEQQYEEKQKPWESICRPFNLVRA